MENTIEFDEPTHTEITGRVETGSTHKYSDVVTKIEYTVRETSVGVRAYNGDEKLYSISFRKLQSAPEEIQEDAEEFFE